MRLQLTEEQAFFKRTTAKFLTETVPVAELRRLRDDPAGFDPAYWRRGADLGWTSLLVDEARGGGSLSDEPIVDLALVAYEFGRHAAPGPLVPANVVASALNDGRGEGADHTALLAGLVSGAEVATWCHGEPHPNDRLGDVALEARVEGSEIVLGGVKRPVEAAAQARHLLVTGRTRAGLTQVLVPTDAPGLSIEPMQSVDLTRRFSTVRFTDVRLPITSVLGQVGEAGDQIQRQLQVALVLLCAESVGTMQAAFDMTLEWAFDRFSFGRPLASYQELKHRFADMKMWLEASHATCDAAASAVAARSVDAAELASVAKAYIGQFGAELLQDCVQLHGGIGITFEHDLHLYLRRLTVNRALLGTPADHRQRIATLYTQGQAA